jgi:histidine ammonia-lyase
VAVVQRIYRFSNPFFTVVSPKDLLKPEERAAAAPTGAGYDPAAIWEDIQPLAQNLTPEGVPVSETVEELQSQAPLKVARARAVIDGTFHLLGLDLMTASFWLDLRKIQAPARNFGAAPTAAWTAFRKVVPWRQDEADRPRVPPSTLGYRFLISNKASLFYPPAAQDIDGGRPDGRP